MKIAVLGGGLAGISGARFLTECRGHEVTILEAEEALGGIARTWTRPDGDRFEFGPHFFHSKDPVILETVKPEIANISYPATIFAKSFIHFMLYDYPVSIDNVLSLPRDTAVQVIDELHRTNPEERAKARTFEDYVKALVGETLFDMFFRSYTEKLWGLRVSEIPSSWAPERISFRKSDKRFFPDEWCVYFHRGIGDLGRHLLQGTAVRQVTGARIKRIEYDSTRWRVVTEGGAEAFDGVFSTIPIAQTLEYLGSKEIHPLAYRSIIVMYQEILKDAALPADWIYFPESRYAFTRLFELRRFARTPYVRGKSSITIEIPCVFGDGLWSMRNRELASKIQEQLVATGLYSGNELGDFELVKRRYVYPMQDLASAVGIRNNLLALREYRRVVAAGRLGLFRYMNMDETLISSRKAAEGALGL